MHNPAAVQKNETQNLIWDFDIKTHHQTSGRRPELIVIINKKKKKKRTNKIVEFAVQAHLRIRLKESDKKDKYFELGRELKKIYGT